MSIDSYVKYCEIKMNQPAVAARPAALTCERARHEAFTHAVRKVEMESTDAICREHRLGNRRNRIGTPLGIQYNGRYSRNPDSTVVAIIDCGVMSGSRFFETTPPIHRKSLEF